MPLVCVPLVRRPAGSQTWQVTNACHKAARANLTKFEKDLLDAGLAADGAAAAAAAAAEKEALREAAPTRKRKAGD